MPDRGVAVIYREPSLAELVDRHERDLAQVRAERDEARRALRRRWVGEAALLVRASSWTFGALCGAGMAGATPWRALATALSSGSVYLAVGAVIAATSWMRRPGR